MLRFDPRDPYPLLARTGRSTDYAAERSHSAEVDAWLGFDTERVEAEILREERELGTWTGHQAWVGLPVQTLLTPYTEIRQMLDRIAPIAGDTVVDLGAGYGRMAFVLGVHYPGARFIGYELVAARVQEGRRVLRAHGLDPECLMQVDLSGPDFRPCEAGAYFIYDFGSREAIAKALGDLRRVARARAITVIGRGRASRDAIERGEPWLSQVVDPEHFGNWSVYRSS